MSFDIFHHSIVIKPFESFGLTGKFWEIYLDTVIYTWIGMACLLLLVLIGRYFISRDLSIVSMAYEKTVGLLIDMFNESFSSFNFNYFSFIACIFLFTLFSCIVGVIPFCDEATKDLNTTLAIGLTSFLYIQFQKIKVHGIWGYLKEFMEPVFILFPIHVVGELSKIASMSFRLFGNILGGGIIFWMILQLLKVYQVYFIIYVITLGLMSLILFKTKQRGRFIKIEKFIKFGLNIAFLITWLQMFFGIFEGCIQAFVITMLTTTYLAIGVQHDEDEHVKVSE